MLASIQQILDVAPIKDADNIEVVKVLGWEVVVKKGDFKPGDLCIYIEIDTIVPSIKQFEFLGKNKYRIKTVILKGQISQGICFPLDVFPIVEPPYVGADVTDILRIKKYEKPVPAGMGGIIKQAGLPFNVPKTDEPMIQSSLDLLEKIIDKDVYTSTKMDGTSATYAFKDGEYHVCSRGNSWIEDPKNLYWSISNKYNIREKIKNLEGNFAIQGEIVGPSIQKNPLDLNEHELYVFNIFNIDKYQYLQYDHMSDICNDIGLKVVPVERFDKFNFSLEELIEMAKGTYKSGKQKEGIVIRTLYEPRRISFKVLNNNYKED